MKKIILILTLSVFVWGTQIQINNKIAEIAELENNNIHQFFFNANNDLEFIDISSKFIDFNRLYIKKNNGNIYVQTPIISAYLRGGKSDVYIENIRNDISEDRLFFCYTKTESMRSHNLKNAICLTYTNYKILMKYRAELGELYANL